jgi:cytochrome c oxidase assembly protein Cox11
VAADKSKKVVVDRSKELTVTFAGQVAADLPWEFEPVQDHVDLYPGNFSSSCLFNEV